MQFLKQCGANDTPPPSLPPPRGGGFPPRHSEPAPRVRGSPIRNAEGGHGIPLGGLNAENAPRGGAHFIALILCLSID